MYIGNCDPISSFLQPRLEIVEARMDENVVLLIRLEEFVTLEFMSLKKTPKTQRWLTLDQS